MTKEMMDAMKQDKVKLLNVSSKIEVLFPEKDSMLKYATNLKELFDKNLNGAIFESIRVFPNKLKVTSYSDTNEEIKDILDVVVENCFNAKNELDDESDIIIIINGEKTVI